MQVLRSHPHGPRVKFGSLSRRFLLRRPPAYSLQPLPASSLLLLNRLLTLPRSSAAISAKRSFLRSVRCVWRHSPPGKPPSHAVARCFCSFISPDVINCCRIRPLLFRRQILNSRRCSQHAISRCCGVQSRMRSTNGRGGATPICCLVAQRLSRRIFIMCRLL